MFALNSLTHLTSFSEQLYEALIEDFFGRSIDHLVKRQRLRLHGWAFSYRAHSFGQRKAICDFDFKPAPVKHNGIFGPVLGADTDNGFRLALNYMRAFDTNLAYFKALSHFRSYHETSEYLGQCIMPTTSTTTTTTTTTSTTTTPPRGDVRSFETTSDDWISDDASSGGFQFSYEDVSSTSTSSSTTSTTTTTPFRQRPPRQPRRPMAVSRPETCAEIGKPEEECSDPHPTWIGFPRCYCD